MSSRSDTEAGSEAQQHTIVSEPPLRFRFKTRDTAAENSQDEVRSSKRRRHHHHHHHSYHRDEHDASYSRRKRHPLTGTDSDVHLNPDRAFQESLFDALGDDEGADFWQSVYGQPIHNYANTIRNEDTGCVEHMDDEEYAQFVRRKMWERSREGIEEAREQRRQQERKEKESKRAEQQRQYTTATSSEAHNNWAFDFEIEASLRRGRRRRDNKRWQGIWANYLQKWQDLKTLANNRNGHDNDNSDQAPTKLVLGEEIAWPVESGKRQDLQPDKIEAFFTKAVSSMDRDQDRSDSLHTVLKQERILWHPDKMQQRYGFMKIDEPTMQGITATFQVLDRMWNESKASSKS